MKDISAHLVYQNGIANVFTFRGDKKVRLLQADYHTCETFVRGMRQAGANVFVWHCDKTGDIKDRTWAKGKGNLWKDEKNPPVRPWARI